MTVSDTAPAGERERAAALARHYRSQEKLSIAEIAERLGRAPATISAYLYDPDGAKAKQVKDRYRGFCRVCGGSTGGSGPGRSRTLCARCNGRSTLKWERELIEAALRAWQRTYGEAATSTDLSMTHAERAGGERLRRLQRGWERGRWPAACVVQYHYGTVANANAIALGQDAATSAHRS